MRPSGIENARKESLVFVGAGFRTTMFLASHPELLTARPCIVESSSRTGPGAYGDLLGMSNSTGRSLFRHVDLEAEPLRLGADPAVASLASRDSPVSLPELARALAHIGKAIEGALPHGAVLPGHHVTRIDITGHDELPVRLTLNEDRHIAARVCVLGTGRTERLNPVLEPARDRVWPSAGVLSRAAAGALRAKVRSSHLILILGCSHSAFAALERILGVSRDLARSEPGFKSPGVRLVHRRDVRVRYDSIEQALRAWTRAGSRGPDPRDHVCPVTGEVFRDTGLRGSAAALWRAVVAGDLNDVRMQSVGHLREAADLIAQADLVVQALGYSGRVPEVRVSGRPLASGPLPVDDDGFVALGAGPGSAQLAALRVDPTPIALRDRGAYGSGLYQRLARRLGPITTQSDVT